jgi:rhodanese-related sulfurtransferase
MNFEKLIRDKVGTIVDVRSQMEFSSGHAEGSVNYPLQDLDHKMNEISKLPQPLILCCASGNRSGIATQIIGSKGIACVNAGSWMDVNYIQSMVNS